MGSPFSTGYYHLQALPGYGTKGALQQVGEGEYSFRWVFRDVQDVRMKFRQYPTHVTIDGVVVIPEEKDGWYSLPIVSARSILQTSEPPTEVSFTGTELTWENKTENNPLHEERPRIWLYIFPFPIYGR